MSLNRLRELFQSGKGAVGTFVSMGNESVVKGADSSLPRPSSNVSVIRDWILSLSIQNTALSIQKR